MSTRTKALVGDVVKLQALLPRCALCRRYLPRSPNPTCSCGAVYVELTTGYAELVRCG